MYQIIGVDGKEYGPVSADQVRQWISAGRANGQTLANLVGDLDWKPLGSFAEFSGWLNKPPPMPPKELLPSSASSVARPTLPNYLAPAILATLCCCLPLGIPAIFYSTQVSSKLEAGDIAGATKASANARIWCWIAFGTGALLSLGYLVIGATSGLLSLGKM